MSTARNASPMVALATLLAALALASMAHASATLYTEGHTLDFAALGRTTVFTQPGFGFPITCASVDLGAAAIPASPNNHETRALSIRLGTPPSYGGCVDQFGASYAIATSGAWTLSFSWGASSTISLGVPANGVHVNLVEEEESLPCASNERAATLSGSWQNGFASPTFVDSVASFNGRLPMAWTCMPNYGELLVQGTNVAVTDATNRANVILLGP